MNLPFANLSFGNGSGPNHRIVRFLLRPIGMAKDNDKAVVKFDMRECVPVPGEHLKELLPCLHHVALRLVDVSIAVNEDVVFCHQPCQPVEIPSVDALIEQQNGLLGILHMCVGNRHDTNAATAIQMCQP